MEKVRRLRAMGSLCRQQAAYNGMNKWKLLAEAEYWEHLAQLELSSCFRECNATGSDEIAPPQAPTEANDDRRNGVAAMKPISVGHDMILKQTPSMVDGFR